MQAAAASTSSVSAQQLCIKDTSAARDLSLRRHLLGTPYELHDVVLARTSPAPAPAPGADEAAAAAAAGVSIKAPDTRPQVCARHVLGSLGSIIRAYDRLCGWAGPRAQVCDETWQVSGVDASATAGLVMVDAYIVDGEFGLVLRLHMYHPDAAVAPEVAALVRLERLSASKRKLLDIQQRHHAYHERVASIRAQRRRVDDTVARLTAELAAAQASAVELQAQWDGLEQDPLREAAAELQAAEAEVAEAWDVVQPGDWDILFDAA